MIYVTFNGQSSLLVLAEPEWQTAPKVTLTTPGDVAAANYGQESRRAFAKSLRYTLEYTPQTETLAQSTAIRQALNVYRSQPVVCPLWTDAVQMAVNQVNGSTLLPVAASPGLPARSGTNWIVVNLDTQAFEFISVSSVDAAGLHLSAGTAFAWPAGTLAYPLLVGRLDPRPTLSPITDQTFSGAFTVVEDSSYDYALWPNAPAPGLIGASVPEMANVPLWTVPPDWQEPSDVTEADQITDDSLGFGRQVPKMDYPQAVRRKYTADFTGDGSSGVGRATIAQIEAHWFDRRGRTKIFAYPTFHDDLSLTNDLLAGATTMVVDATAWTQVQYTAHPGSAFLALVDGDDGVEPIRVVEIDVAQVDIHSPVQRAHPAASTRVSHLLLARFAEETLEWEYTTDTHAQTTLTFLEMSGEYAAPLADLPEPVFLYLFQMPLPNGSVQSWAYTSYEQPWTSAGVTYAPQPISHADTKSTLKLDQEQVTIKSWAVDGNPMRLAHFFALEAPLNVLISEADARYPANAPTVLFSGQVSEPKTTGKSIEAKATAFGTTFDANFPTALLQPGCNKVQYTRACGLNPDAWRRAAVVQSLNPQSTQLGVTLTGGAAVVAGAFAGGWLEIGADVSQQVRDILDSTAAGAGGNTTLSINRPLRNAALGAGVSLVPGCGNTYAGCSAFGNQAQYFGFDFVPVTSPSIQAVPSANSGGGKK